MKKENAPPRWAIRFFLWYCNDHLADAVLGDLLQLYDRRLETYSKRKADFLFIFNALQFIQPFAIRRQSPSHTVNSVDMIENYFKIAWRNMLLQRMYTAIKVGGFAIGLATCMVIALYLRHELNYDTHYADRDNIYRLYNEETGPDAGKWISTPPMVASMIKESYPEIISSGRLILQDWYNAGENLVRRDDQAENTFEEGFAYADNDLLTILEIPMVYGDRATALKNPKTIVISREKADKYFKGEDPLGKTLVLDDDLELSFTIGGVMENFSPNSHLQVDFFITLSGVEFWQGEQADWCCWNYANYLKVRPGTNVADLEAKLASMKDVYIEYLSKEKNQNLENFRKHYSLRLQRIDEVYLYSSDIHDHISHGDIRYIWLFGGIAIFILLLACINFINLSTARSTSRAKEVGLRKVIGSNRGLLVKQFLSESILFSIVSFVLAILILTVTLPHFRALAGKDISVPWTEWWFIPTLGLCALVLGIVAGLYPAFYLSRFKPIDVLKGRIATGFKITNLRSAMVVFQFTTSIILIVGTFIIYQQMQFILTTKVGYDKEQVLMVRGINTLGDRQKTFKEELMKLAAVENVTATQYFPVEGMKRDQNEFWRDGKSKEERGFGAQVWYVDEDYIETMGMKLAAGRFFTDDFASDTSSIVINETMAKRFGFSDPIGEKIMTWRTWNVIGVVEDFHFASMKGKIGPLALVRGDFGDIAAVKLKTNEMQNALASITAVWKKFLPNQPVRVSFLDDHYERMYDDVRRTGNIFASFAALAIIVACLGLFALSAFMVEQRSKEISIRIVLGATLQNIFRMLTGQFIKLVFVSFVIAVPISWYIMNKWLQDYEYKIEINWDVFAIAGLSSIIIALLTVSYQSIRAALANPTSGLRSQ